MIDATRILQLDLLDLLFDERNKSYGAYELRRNYGKRMLIAVIVMLFCSLLLFLVFTYGSKSGSHSSFAIADPILVDLPKAEHHPEITPPPPPKAKLPDVKIKQFTQPLITKDDVKPDERPPENAELETAKIGKVNVNGADDAGIAPPVADEGKGVISAPKKNETDYEKTFTKVEIESEYPGGSEAWKHYLGKNLRYPTAAQENGIEGTVIVQFIVDKQGVVSDVTAISGPNELREEAVRVIKKSGNWNPAIQNGRPVKSYKSQPIIFRTADNN